MARPPGTGNHAAETFLAATAAASGRTAGVLVCGVPWDAASTFRRGPAAGPVAIRQASQVLEEHSLALGLSLDDLDLRDAGDCPVDLAGPPAAAIRSVEAWLTEQAAAHLSSGGLLVTLGGDHLASVPAVAALATHAGAQPRVLILDAHADLRPDWEGEPLSHACVAWLLHEALGAGRVQAAGIRSATREEAVLGHRLGLAWARRDAAGPCDLVAEALAALATLPGDGPLYLSVDIDVCDPGYAPGVGAPEPGGVTSLDLIQAVRAIARAAGAQLRGLDVVEVSPAHDAGGATATLAALLVREAVLARLTAPPSKAAPSRTTQGGLAGINCCNRLG